jgi:hypothetical protein
MIYRIGCTALVGGALLFIVERMNDQIGIYGAVLIVVGALVSLTSPRIQS